MSRNENRTIRYKSLLNVLFVFRTPPQVRLKKDPIAQVPIELKIGVKPGIRYKNFFFPERAAVNKNSNDNCADNNENK